MPVGVYVRSVKAKRNIAEAARGNRNAWKSTRWRCGHKKTAKNIIAVSTSRPGGRCKRCAYSKVDRYHETRKARVASARRQWDKAGVDPMFTLDDYDRMLAEQGGVCAWCGKPLGTVRCGRGVALRFQADHDPMRPNEVGNVRGLVHGRCNWRIGIVEKNIERFESYLKMYAQRRHACTTT